MLFDWVEYLTLAQRLATESGEASQRSAVSRAYYAAFHAARSLLESTENFHVSQSNPAHKQVWDAYRRKGRTHTAVGINGDRLRLNRAHADYDPEIENLSGLVEDSLEKAERVFRYLDQIQGAEFWPSVRCPLDCERSERLPAVAVSGAPAVVTV